MADRQDIYDRINELLENTEFPFEVKDISDVESFLEDEENQQYEEYEEIEEMYNQVMEETDFDEE